jgi:hypothetical protein
VQPRQGLRWAADSRPHRSSGSGHRYCLGRFAHAALIFVEE